MFKKTQFALLVAGAAISMFAGSVENVAGWWTDHEPNHIIAPTQPPVTMVTPGEVTIDGWWTDHEPNH